MFAIRYHKFVGFAGRIIFTFRNSSFLFLRFIAGDDIGKMRPIDEHTGMCDSARQDPTGGIFALTAEPESQLFIWRKT
jgi:hypothetical protein